MTPEECMDEIRKSFNEIVAETGDIPRSLVVSAEVYEAIKPLIRQAKMRRRLWECIWIQDHMIIIKREP
jgi:hypothetical protein